MRVALISPRGAERYHTDNFVYNTYRKLRRELIFALDDLERMPHVGLLTLAAYLPDDWEAVYVDEDYLHPDEASRRVLDDDFDLVLVTAINTQAYRAYQIADHHRARGATVALGGLHVTAMPDEAQAHADAVFVGEAEETFAEFLDDFRHGRVKPRYACRNRVDLTRIPVPRWDLIDDFSPFKTITLFATRGCPRACDYCYLPGAYGPRHRHKTVDQVLAEIDRACSLFPSGQKPLFQFADENMLLDRKWAKGLLRELRGMNVVWEAFSDNAIADDPELLDLLREAHCLELQMGFETENPENFRDRSRWKFRQVPRYKQSMQRILDAGVGIQALFIVGFDNDDREVFRRLRDFVYDSPLYCAEIAALTPFPGTELYRRMKREGRLLTENWERYTWIHVNFQPANMSPEELMEGIMWLFIEFTAPEMIDRRLRHFRRVFSDAGQARDPATAVPLPAAPA